ncbi:MAG: glycerol-3-phosphate dehydrogenase subunit GlpB [Candidatus Promineifilaceae bacterium]
MNDKENILVIGAGLAGLTAAWRIALAGKKVRLVAKGWGATHWHSGCIDVLGYYPLDSRTAVRSPAEGIEQLIAENDQHPYAHVGVEGVSAALEAFQALCAEAGYPMHGSLDKNWLLPSAVGTMRPTCLAPEMMIAGDLEQDSPMLLVGFQRFGDFFANVAADNLTQQGFFATHAMVELPSLSNVHVLSGVILARMMEQAAFRAEVVAAVKPHLGKAERVGFPAVLGRGKALAVKADLEAQLGRPVFEIPILPPSVPGIRLHHILKGAIEGQGGRVFDGMEAVGSEAEDGRVTAVLTESAARNRRHSFGQYVLATGGILGGGITTNFEGHAKEVVFDLPVSIPKSRLDWYKRDFMDKDGHPVYRAGVTVDEAFRPINGDGRAVYENVYAAGTMLGHAEVIRERSMEGVALATGYKVGNWR